MSLAPRLVLALILVSPPARGEQAEGEIAPPGECARAPELPPPGPLRNSLADLFPPVGVGSGGGSDAGGLPGAPAIADVRSSARPGACDDPGSGCAGPLRDAPPVVPPGGTLLPDGWIRFPDGSLLPPQRPTPAPLQTAAPPAGAP